MSYALLLADKKPKEKLKVTHQPITPTAEMMENPFF